VLLMSSRRRGASTHRVPDRAGPDLLDRRPPRRAVPAAPAWDVVEEWGLQSFPASDPPANW
jgi:hypothetical protein